MEMCVKLRSFDVARRINSYMHIRKMHYSVMSVRNSAPSQRNDDRLPCLEVRRHRGAGLRNEKGVTVAPRRCSSTSLYTPPAEGENVPFVLKPELDFNALLRDGEKFEKSIEARNMELEGINIPEMISIWKEVCDLEEQKNQMERKKKALNTRAKELSKQKGGSVTKEKVQLEGRKIREEVKSLNTSLNGLMNRLYPLALALPNSLHSAVPVGDENVVKETVGDGLVSLESRKEHPSISTHHPMVHPGYCYTEGELVIKELDLVSSAASHLASNGFTRFAMPDMYKPLLREALGLNAEEFNETYAIQTRENLMHLAGTSPMGFLAYYMNSVLEASDLPQRCFAVGRHYNAAAESAKFQGLHHQYQDSRLEIFGVSEGAEDSSNALLFQYLHIVTDLISTFDLPFRVVEVSSKNLLPCMHRQMAVELWIPSERNYIEVANVCNCTDFISRRLKIRYPTNPRESAAQSRKRSFGHTIHGTALKTSVLLSAMLDYGALDLKEAKS
eukprot:XP_785096.2 PREDICTED: serine--tRNA ligase, mitochondrial [Strongylocentrotus purpuratus]